MTSVVFQPAGNSGGRSHYVDTIANPVSLIRLSEHLGPELIQGLRSVTHGDAVPVWGVTPGANGLNEKKWQRLEPGDWAFFLQNGRAVSVGRVAMKTHAPELAKKLWGTQADGQIWEFVYFLEGVRPVDIPYAALNAAARYKPGNQFMGFTVLDGPAADDVIRLVEGNGGDRAAREPIVWCVRPGRDGVALTQFVEQSVVAIGWNEIGDPSRFPDAVALKEALRTSYPGEDADSAAGVIRRFLREMATSDLVITPTADAVYVGRVVGDAKYDSGGTFHSFRPVEWVTTIRRTALTDEMRRSIGSQLSVFRVWGTGADEWLRLAESGRASEPRGAGAATWLVRQASSSGYRDLAGIEYEYPARIPNGKQIRAGDVLVCYRNQDEAGEHPIFGLGRVGRVDDRGQQRVASYDRYLVLTRPASWSDIGGDPRNNPRNSINAAPAEVLERLLRSVGIATLEDLPSVQPEPTPPSAIREPPGQWRLKMTIDDLIALTHWTRPELEELCALITERASQVILAGPPGTSKTWVARLVSRYLTQRDGQRLKTVQFHPSYSYEEFIEGLRPDANDEGVIVFRPVPGVLLRMLDEAGEDPGPHILLIDEMNRANLPKVLGELMYLFEYRDEMIDLRYRSDFRLPPSIKFVGTMNTADRSIRSIDSALRRRFAILECPPRRDILESYYSANGNDLPGLLDGFERLNAELTTKLDRHHTIGHAFLMQPHMTLERLRDAWKYRISPLLEEYFFDQPDVAASFAFEQFWPV